MSVVELVLHDVQRRVKNIARKSHPGRFLPRWPLEEFKKCVGVVPNGLQPQMESCRNSRLGEIKKNKTGRIKNVRGWRRIKNDTIDVVTMTETALRRDWHFVRWSIKVQDHYSKFWGLLRSSFCISWFSSFMKTALVNTLTRLIKTKRAHVCRDVNKRSQALVSIGSSSSASQQGKMLKFLSSEACIFVDRSDLESWICT